MGLCLWQGLWSLGMAAPEPCAPSLGAGRDPVLSPLRGGQGTPEDKGAAAAESSQLWGHPHLLPSQRAAPITPSSPMAVTVPFSLQHERARGLRARRCHWLHQHQLAQVCGVQWDPPRCGEKPPTPRASSPSSLRLWG